MAGICETLRIELTIGGGTGTGQLPSRPRVSGRATFKPEPKPSSAETPSTRVLGPCLY